MATYWIFIQVLKILILFAQPPTFYFEFQEKYGPKGQGKTFNVATAKPNKDSKQRPEVDINVGLSDRPPWFCRYITYIYIGYNFYFLLPW